VKVEEWSGQGPGNIETKGADVIEALPTPKRARSSTSILPPTRKWTRVFFFPPIHQRINDIASMRGFTIGAKDGSACFQLA